MTLNIESLLKCNLYNKVFVYEIKNKFEILTIDFVILY